MSIYSNASIFLVLEKLPISMKLFVIKWKPISIVLLLLLMLSMPYFFAGKFLSGKSMGDYLERSRMFMLGFGYLLVAFSS
ncbi:hypothetical protein Gotur_022212 [Gossypium turneri]